MRRHPAITATTAFVVLAGLAAGAHAENIWKWVDAKGVPHYSDRPVPGAVLIKSVATGATDSSDASSDQQQLAASSQQTDQQLKSEQAARTVKQDEAAVRAQQCKAAQTRYQQVIHARRIYTTDANGNRQYLSDADAEKDRVQAEQDVQSLCGTDSDSSSD
ncbi:MAG: DUF4124 domain-containing protein [Steroidobacteraceae bacterium]